jgi:hypothetical protein
MIKNIEVYSLAPDALCLMPVGYFYTGRKTIRRQVKSVKKYGAQDTKNPRRLPAAMHGSAMFGTPVYWPNYENFVNSKDGDGH